MSEWLFCNQCGTILNPPQNDMIKCTFCPFKQRVDEGAMKEIVTVSLPTQRPEWLDVEVEQEVTEKHATIEEPCPKCNYHELYFYTMQLRSVDEGSTVFYECPKCAYKFSVNN